MMGYKQRKHKFYTLGSIALSLFTTMTLHEVYCKPAINEGNAPIIEDMNSLASSNSMYEEDQGFGLFSRRKLGGILTTSNEGIPPIVQNDMSSVASSDSIYDKDQGLALFSRRYPPSNLYDYGDFDNMDYSNVDYSPPQPLNPAMSYDSLDNPNSDLSSLNSFEDPSMAANIYYQQDADSSYFPNKPFPNQPQNSFMDYLSPKPEHSIPEYNIPNYGGAYDYGSIPEYPVRPDYPLPRPEYPDYEDNNDDCNTPVVNKPCTPCQWYNPCCFNNCIQSCEKVTESPWPWPTPDPIWPTISPTDVPLPKTTSLPKPKCHVPGWHFIKGKEIYLSKIYRNDKTLSWFEADSKAESIGGYLAEITSKEETDLLNQIKECYPYGVPGFWIGGSDMANHTNWVWSRGTPVDCIGCYTNWVVPNVQGPKDHCMKLKFEEVIDEGSGDNEDGNTSPEILFTNKWHKKICKGEPAPTAFLAERIEGTLPSPTEAKTEPSTRPTIPTIPTSEATTPVQPTDGGPV